MRPPLQPTEPTNFGAVPFRKKSGRPFAGQAPISESPRQTQAAPNRNLARQQSLIPIPIEPSRKPVQLIPVDNQRPQPVVQQIPQDEFQKIKQQQSKLQQPQPQQPRAPIVPLPIDEESFEDIEEEEDEPELIEQPKSAQLPQQRKPVPAGGVFSIPQQPQQQQPQQQPQQQQQPLRQAAQTDYPRRFETFTPSTVTRQRSGLCSLTDCIWPFHGHHAFKFSG